MVKSPAQNILENPEYNFESIAFEERDKFKAANSTLHGAELEIAVARYLLSHYSKFLLKNNLGIDLDSAITQIQSFLENGLITLTKESEIRSLVAAITLDLTTYNPATNAVFGFEARCRDIGEKSLLLGTFSFEKIIQNIQQEVRIALAEISTIQWQEHNEYAQQLITLQIKKDIEKTIEYIQDLCARLWNVSDTRH